MGMNTFHANALASNEPSDYKVCSLDREREVYVMESMMSYIMDKRHPDYIRETMQMAVQLIKDYRKYYQETEQLNDDIRKILSYWIKE